MIKIVYVSLIICFSSFAWAGNENFPIERRAAFDIGSSKIKVLVADVDTTHQIITRILFAWDLTVPLREDLSKGQNGQFSKEIQDETVRAISQLLEKAAPFQPQRFSGIATESFRLAENRDEVVEKILFATGVPIKIISQEDEGILGFITAVSEANVELDQAVSWDFGAGSYQITAKGSDRYLFYKGNLGKVPMKNVVMKIQGNGSNRSPNPISQTEADQAVQIVKESLGEVSIPLREKIKNPNTVVLGIGINPLWRIHEAPNYDKETILNELKKRLDLDDEAVRLLIDSKSEPIYSVSNLILVYGVMDALEIETVHYVGTPGGNGAGILLSPEYWKQ